MNQTEKVVKRPEDEIPFHTKKFVWRFICIAAIVIILLCIALVIHETAIKEVDMQGKEVLTSDQGVQYYLDHASWEKKIRNEEEVVIDGWCVIPGKTTSPIEIHVLLKDSATQNVYQLPTTTVMRGDVTSHIDDGQNYDNSGFSVHIITNNLQIADHSYEILLLYKIGKEEYVISLNENLD